MTIKTEKFTISTKGFGDIIDITPKVENFISYNNILEGVVNITVLANSASVFAIEYEPGVIADFNKLLDELIPINGQYKHNSSWENNNAYSHLRATLLRNNITLPIISGELKLDMWQKIVLADFDTKTRVREVVISIIY